MAALSIDVLQSANHTLIANNIILSQIATLTVRGANHTQTTNNIILSQAGTITTVRGCNHTLIANNITLSKLSTLALQGANHTLIANNISLTWEELNEPALSSPQMTVPVMLKPDLTDLTYR